MENSHGKGVLYSLWVSNSYNNEEKNTGRSPTFCWRIFPRGKAVPWQLHSWSLRLVCLSATPQGHSKIGRQGSTHLTKPVECIEQERAQKFPFLLGERIQLPFHLQVSQVQRATWDRISREHSGLHLLPILSSLHGPFSKPVTIPMAIWSKLHPLLARKSLPLLYGQQSISASITN